jgi:hypothetical protein
MRRYIALFAVLFSFTQSLHATVFATIHGVVHDGQHRPIAGAQIVLQAADSQFILQAVSAANGGFELREAPIGTYLLKAQAKGFAAMQQQLTLNSGTNPVVHMQLAVAAAAQTVEVREASFFLSAADTATTTTLVSRTRIEETPGASRTNGMEMITDFVPGSYMTHDMLHMRGGHQTSWLIDGVSIPNTKIAANLGPQIDPKDIEQLETQRGSYAADLGDRTYGVFNVLPRNGFERNRDAEVLLSAGNFYSAASQFSLGDHGASTAWYASLNGSRSNYGLSTPVAAVDHDATNSESGFLSLLHNQSARDQIRLNAQYREDFYQIPYDPNSTDWEQASQYYESWGLRDGQTERDGFVMANWVHTPSSRALVSLAPFVHFNQSNYDAMASDLPVATTWHQRSNYLGAQGDARYDLGRNHFSAGLYSFWQNEEDLYGVQVNDGSADSEPNASSSANAGLVEFYLSDHLRIGRYLTLLGGERFTIYRAGLNESAIYPRLGATFQTPRLHWIFRGFYGHFFQPAPVETVSSSALNYAAQQGSGQNTFTALPSERDEEHQFGVTIPWRGWVMDIANSKNRVNNFLDHANLGESNMYFPIAVDGALIRAWEMTLRSPELARLGAFHLAYSNQIAQQRGNIIGGFTCSDPNDPACVPGPGYISLDHDQRHTLNAGFSAHLPGQFWFSSNVYYGSGFTNGLTDSGSPYAGNYLPVHTTFDLSAGHSFGEHWRLAASVLNATNHRVLLDNSITVGGFHWNDPRLISADLRYRFHF